MCVCLGSVGKIVCACVVKFVADELNFALEIICCTICNQFAGGMHTCMHVYIYIYMHFASETLGSPFLMHFAVRNHMVHHF